MNIILVAGPHAHALQPVWQALQTLGVQTAKPSRREHLLPEQIHKLMSQALAHRASLEKTDSLLTPAGGPKLLGKVWNELAADLCLANIEHRFWGWLMPATDPLLDYWLDFDACTRLVLAYTTPTEYLQQQLQGVVEVTPYLVDQVLAQWNHDVEALLVRFHAHSPRCLLVHAETAQSQSQSLSQVMESQWALQSLKAEAAVSVPDNTPSTYEQSLLQQMVNGFPDTVELWQELEATAHLNSPVKSSEPLTVYHHWAQQASANSTQLKQSNQALAHVTRAQDAIQTIAHLEAVNVRLEAEKTHLASAFDTQASTHTQAFAQALAQRDAQAQENELLLVQVHQVQEELEQLFIKHQSVASKAAQSAEQLQALQADLAEAKSIQLEQSNQALAHVKHAQDAIQTIAHLEAVNARPEAEKAHLANAVDIHASTHAQAFAQALGQRDAQAQENELLLLQLHQVQEELEHYFLQYQNATQQHQRQLQPLQSAADFWQRHPPEVVLLNLCDSIDGQNWYHAEVDGRWAGPGLTSTLQMPPMPEGSYQIELHIHDTMDPAILLGMQVNVIGAGRVMPMMVELVHNFESYDGLCPMLSVGQMELPTQFMPWVLEVTLPYNICPADLGGDDTRRLGLKVQVVRLIRLNQMLDAAA